MEGKKIRGSDTEPNFVLIGGQFYKVTPELVSFEFILPNDNITVLAYSKVFKQIFVRYKAGLNKPNYLINDVSVSTWQKRYLYERAEVFFCENIAGNNGKATTQDIEAVSNEYVLDHLLKLEYQCTIVKGLWATECPEKVIDPENVLFQIE